MLTPQTLSFLVWSSRFMRIAPALITSAFVMRTVPAIEAGADALQAIGGQNQNLAMRVVRFVSFAPVRAVAGAGAGAIRGALNRAPVENAVNDSLVVQILKNGNDYLILPGKEFVPYLTMVGTKLVVTVIIIVLVYWISSQVCAFVVHYIDLRIEAAKGSMTTKNDGPQFGY